MTKIAMELYARPGGGHFHASLDCPMLTRGQFEELKYRRVYWSEAKKRRLKPCICAGTTGNRRRTIVERMLEANK